MQMLRQGLGWEASKAQTAWLSSMRSWSPGMSGRIRRRPHTLSCCSAQAHHIGPSFHFQGMFTGYLISVPLAGLGMEANTQTQNRAARGAAPAAGHSYLFSGLPGGRVCYPPGRGAMVASSSCCPNSSSTVLVSIW